MTKEINRSEVYIQEFRRGTKRFIWVRYGTDYPRTGTVRFYHQPLLRLHYSISTYNVLIDRNAVPSTHNVNWSQISSNVDWHGRGRIRHVKDHDQINNLKKV